MKNNKKMYSIKKRITLSMIALSSVFILISLFFSYSSSHHEILEVYDARLGQTAKLFLLSLPDSGTLKVSSENVRQLDGWMQNIRDAHSGDEATAYGHPYEQKLLIQLYRDGKVVWGSHLRNHVIVHDPTYSGFGYVEIADKEWRYFQLPLTRSNSQHSEYIIVAEQQAVRNEMITELAFSTLVPQLVLIPCLALVLYFLIDRHFAPITELQQAISRRSVSKLDSVTVGLDTTELSSLVTTLNRLLAELDSAWKREKRFTGMAAHELKTPLAVLRLNAENALNSDREEDLQTDLHNILRGIERSDRLIQQLLTLARVENIHSMERVEIDLKRLVQYVMGELAPLALRNKQEMSLTGDNCLILGDESLLGILLSNLIDNAIRYAGKGQQITVTLKDLPDRVQVYVSDTGEDLTAEAREKLFESFYRSNRERGDGAGLGLSITRDIVKLHYGTVELLPRKDQANTFLVSLMKNQHEL
ncbi:ATP-binding protein [Vibrio ruber]|uniref:ATP-binding protein n=1 Tax=Vibrio ruber TaxID=184755 RepID=UPI002892A62B|nr:ATP-binding protein [Vibrio ruber]WNJ97874.1 ATP-binding protein [Vibrio ruber]